MVNELSMNRWENPKDALQQSNVVDKIEREQETLWRHKRLPRLVWGAWNSINRRETFGQFDLPNRGE